MDNRALNSKDSSLRELATLFLRLGTFGFGGPAAHIAMMEDEVVRRRSWLSREQFLDLLAVTNFIPGPNSTEMAIHVGYERAGFRGLVVAGVSFIAPAFVIVSIIAWAYVRYGSLPITNAALYGIKPVVIAVVIQALWRLGRNAIKNQNLAIVTIIAALASLLGVGELMILALAAVAWAILGPLLAKTNVPITRCIIPAGFMPFKPIAYTAAASAAASSLIVTVTLPKLFLAFLKIGSILFGSGYVLLAFLRADFVERLHWLTESQLLDAVAVGQITPGPVFTTATFIGYLVAGPVGALVATVGIFLPAFAFVGISAPIIPQMRKSKILASMLDGLNVASLALMAVVTLHLAHVAIFDWTTALLALISAALLVRWNVNSIWLVLAGGILGLAKAL